MFCVLKVRAGDHRVGVGIKGANDNVRRNAGEPTKSIITRDPPTVNLQSCSEDRVERPFNTFRTQKFCACVLDVFVNCGACKNPCRVKRKSTPKSTPSTCARGPAARSAARERQPTYQHACSLINVRHNNNNKIMLLLHIFVIY